MKQKRLFILVVSLLMMFGSTRSQTIHWITFFDTQNANIGSMSANERQLLLDRFINVINKELTLAGYKSSIHDYYGETFSLTNCMNAITQLQCDSLDIVVFHYSGFGFHATNEETPFPSLNFNSNLMSEAIPLAWVHHELKNKHPKLVITIGECSNIEYKDINTNLIGHSVALTNQLNRNVTQEVTRLSSIQQLFLCTEGEVILSAASLGQDATGGATSFGNMGWMTAALILTFEEISNGNQCSWEEFIDAVSSAVKDVSDGKQVPLYQYDLIETSMSRNK